MLEEILTMNEEVSVGGSCSVRLAEQSSVGAD